jgi:hypothetical protein
MEEGNHILFADIEDRLGTLLMRWSVPPARTRLGQFSLFERQSEFEN